MRKHFCNGCQHQVSEDDFHTVRVEVVCLPGEREHFGLATNRRIAGELCRACIEMLADFVAETDGDTTLIAYDVIRPRSEVAA